MLSTNAFLFLAFLVYTCCTLTGKLSTLECVQCNGLNAIHRDFIHFCHRFMMRNAELGIWGFVVLQCIFKSYFQANLTLKLHCVRAI